MAKNWFGSFTLELVKSKIEDDGYYDSIEGAYNEIILSIQLEKKDLEKTIDQLNNKLELLNKEDTITYRSWHSRGTNQEYVQIKGVTPEEYIKDCGAPRNLKWKTISKEDFFKIN